MDLCSVALIYLEDQSALEQVRVIFWYFMEMKFAFAIHDMNGEKKLVTFFPTVNTFNNTPLLILNKY